MNNWELLARSRQEYFCVIPPTDSQSVQYWKMRISRIFRTHIKFQNVKKSRGQQIFFKFYPDLDIDRAQSVMNHTCTVQGLHALCHRGIIVYVLQFDWFIPPNAIYHSLQYSIYRTSTEVLCSIDFPFSSLLNKHIIPINSSPNRTGNWTNTTQRKRKERMQK